MPDENLYADERTITDPKECDYYHVIDLPGYGLAEGPMAWDLRGREGDYLGGVDFRGKRVLELGPASGYLTLRMEKNGADVTSFDISDRLSWDFVPYAQLDLTDYIAGIKGHIRRLNNSWWLTRRVFGLRARVVYGNIYDIPPALGTVDVATFAAILLHLRDPFWALHNALRLTKETAVVTDVDPEQPPGFGFMPPEQPAPAAERVSFRGRMKGLVRGMVRGARTVLGPAARMDQATKSRPPTMLFCPNYKKSTPDSSMTWWSLTPEIVVAFLGVLGFEETKVTYHSQRITAGHGCPASDVRFYTVVGSRTRPMRESRTGS